MRFAMVTTFYPPHNFGGDGAYVRALSRALVERGHHVEVVHCADAFELLNGGPPATEGPADPGIVVHTIRSGMGALSPLYTQQSGLPGPKRGQLSAILDRGFDVIHFHNISLIGGPGVLGLGKARCRLYTLHEHWLVCPTHILWKNRQRACEQPTCFSCSVRSGIPPQLWRYTTLRDRELNRVDRLLAPSTFTADKHRSGGIRQPIEILPHFSALEPAASVRRDGGYFLYVGRITAPKGVDAMVRAVAAAPDLQLRIVGRGALQRPLARALAHCANIEFRSQTPQDELSDLYAGARALIVPSAAPETFGLTVVEAAAHGVASIVRTSAGGALEFGSRTGAGFSYNDEAELIEQMRVLDRAPALATEMGERARAAYFSGYTREHHVAAYLQTIERVASQRAEPR